MLLARIMRFLGICRKNAGISQVIRGRRATHLKEISGSAGFNIVRNAEVGNEMGVVGVPAARRKVQPQIETGFVSG